MSKKSRLMILLVPLMFLLTGCGNVSVDDHGIWSSIAVFFARIIVFFSELLGNNLGLGIIAVTIILRALLIPLYKKQMKSSEHMQKVQPKVQRINKKYENKTSQEDVAKKNQEIQALYKAEGVNPLAGCLPVLIQLPILIVFYSSLTYLVPPSSAQGAVSGIEQLNAGHLMTTLFGIELNNPVLIFALLAALGTFLTTYLTQIGNEQEGAAQSSMRIMLYVMPVIIFFTARSLPGALSVYWVTGSIFTIVQTIVFRRGHLSTAWQRRKMTRQGDKSKSSK